MPVLLILLGSTASAQLRTYTTNHYRIQTDVEPFLADDLARRMDAMYDEYARRLVDFQPRQGSRKFDVYIFQKRSDYLKFTDNRNPNTTGVFMAGKALAAFLDEQGRDELRQTLQHEAFHQFAFYAIGKNLPVWLNEGLAQVFEEGIYNGKTFRLGEVPPWRVRAIQQQIRSGQLIDFRSFMALSDKQWAQDLTASREQGQRQYNQAWAMAHYLIFSDAALGAPEFRRRLIDMLKRVHDGQDGSQAFIDSFSDNLGGFQQMFADYAMSMQPTPIAECIERQDVLAELMIKLNERGRRFSDMASLRRVLDHGQLQTYFRDWQGRDLPPNELYLEPRNGSPLPDIFSRPMDSIQLHTKFTQVGAKIEHETIVEAPGQ